jgi:hypothetical protein
LIAMWLKSLVRSWSLSSRTATQVANPRNQIAECRYSLNSRMHASRASSEVTADRSSSSSSSLVKGASQRSKQDACRPQCWLMGANSPLPLELADEVQLPCQEDSLADRLLTPHSTRSTRICTRIQTMKLVLAIAIRSSGTSFFWMFLQSRASASPAPSRQYWCDHTDHSLQEGNAHRRRKQKPATSHSCPRRVQAATSDKQGRKGTT